jgi:hypothetical protein
MNMESVISELERANPIATASNRSVDEAWIVLVSQDRNRRRGHRRLVGLSGLAAVVLAVGLVTSFAWPSGPNSSVAAAQLTAIAHSVRLEPGIPALGPNQYDYLEVKQSADDISRTIHGKKIEATQVGTSETWMHVKPNGRTGTCQFAQRVGAVSFIGDSERLWKQLGSPDIAAKNSTQTVKSCGRLAPQAFAPADVTPTSLLTALKRAGVPSNGGQTYLALVEFYFAAPVPSPKLRAAILQDLANLKGVTALGTRVDSLGRKGLAFSYSLTRPASCLGNCGPATYVESIIVDPTTGSLLSMTSNQSGFSNTQTVIRHEVVNGLGAIAPAE